jgi:hypothetical protein
MRTRSLLLFGLAFPVATAAGVALDGCGTVVVTAPSGRGGSGAGGGASEGGGGGEGGGLSDASSEYVDPGCPDAGPPITMDMCNPFNQGNGDCAAGEGCYIFSEPPQDPCGQEVYGTACEAAGTGHQGASCTGAGCAPGFACVVSGSGVQCVELCELQGNMSCPDGLVCQPIDVLGYGGCL